MVPQLVVLEDVILDFKELDVGEGIREQFNEGLEKTSTEKAVRGGRCRQWKRCKWRGSSR